MTTVLKENQVGHVRILKRSKGTRSSLKIKHLSNSQCKFAQNKSHTAWQTQLSLVPPQQPSWKNGFAHVELKGFYYLSQKSITKTRVRYHISF